MIAEYLIVFVFLIFEMITSNTIFKLNSKQFNSMILWEKYSEDELRTILKFYYKSTGYEISDIHEADRRGEKGADLVISKPGEAEKIAIALKIKPKKSDINQLKELSERSERQKKYIYIKHPSTDFYFEMDRFKNKVDFWNTEKLTYEFATNAPNLAVWLVVSSHPFYLYLSKINLNLLLIKWRDKEQFGGSNVPDQNFFRKLWRLKDCFSGLNVAFRVLQHIFEMKPIKYSNTPEENLSLLKFLSYVLNVLLGISKLDEMNMFLLELIKNYGKLIERVVEQTHDRSHWLNYLNFDYTLIPNEVRVDLIEKQIRDEVRMYNAFKKFLDERGINVETFH